MTRRQYAEKHMTNELKRCDECHKEFFRASKNVSSETYCCKRCADIAHSKKIKQKNKQGRKIRENIFDSMIKLNFAPSGYVCKFEDCYYKTNSPIGFGKHLRKEHNISWEKYAKEFKTEEWIVCPICGKFHYCTRYLQSIGKLCCSKKCASQQRIKTVRKNNPKHAFGKKDIKEYSIPIVEHSNFGIDNSNRTSLETINKRRAKVSGIYRIENIVNGRNYFGSSYDTDIRLRWHINHLRRGDDTILLQRSWNKYGKDSFTLDPQFFEVAIVWDVKNMSIEQKLSLRENLLYWEQYYMNQSESYNPKKGFNISPTAGSPLGTKWTPERRLKYMKENKLRLSLT